MDALKDRLPTRLSPDPIGRMRTDSDLEVIADAVVGCGAAPDEDASLLLSANEKWLVLACLGYLRDWCQPAQRTLPNLNALLRASLAKADTGRSDLDGLFHEIKSGCSRNADGTWGVSQLVRNDGLRPGDTNGVRPSDDYALLNYDKFARSAPPRMRASAALRVMSALSEGGTADE